MCDYQGFAPVNTFANATFDILSMDNINNEIIPLNQLASGDINESYFQLAVNHIKESNDEYTNSKMTLYKKISEAASENVVLESFSDFFAAVRRIIDKFIKFIKSLYERFINTLARLISSDKYLHKHKNDFSKYPSDAEFEITGFKYTFDPNIPSVSPVAEFNEELFDELYMTGGNANRENIILKIEDIKNAIKNHNPERYYEKFRSKVVNKNGAMDSGEYADDLFSIFRDSDSKSSRITIKSKEVSESSRRFFNYKDDEKSLKRQQSDIIKAYNDLSDSIKKISSVNGTLDAEELLQKMPSGISGIDNSVKNNAALTPEFVNQIDIYIKNKVDLIKEISNIHVLAFSAKLDAVKDCYKQDKAILYTALSKIIKSEAKK